MIEVDEEPSISDVYHRTLIECLPRFWPQTVDIEGQYKKPTFDLLVEVILQSNWQNQLLIIQSINSILQQSSTLTSSDILPLLEPIINLGPRTKSSGLKREMLKFLRILFDQNRYWQCFVDHSNARDMLQFNIDEMIHDTRSNEISEQAKELKKIHEHLFVKIKPKNEQHEQEQTPRNFDSNDLF